MPAPAALPVGILEDDPEYAAYLAGIVADAAEYRLAFCADRVGNALAALAHDPPAIMLIDMQLPDGSGLDLVRAGARLPCRMLMLTVLADRTSVLSALEAGAHGYLLKDTPPAQILTALAQTLRGDAPISPAAASHVLRLLQRTPAQGSPAPTAREIDILQMFSRGLTYAETATALGISKHTVADHIKAIYQKLQVNSKSEALYEARHQGWISLTD